jgi:hypothetical protein
VGGLRHRDNKAPSLRNYQFNPAADHKVVSIALTQGKIRHNLGLPSAHWTRFFIPLLFLLWLAPTVRTFCAGWPQQWPVRPPPFIFP